MNISTVNKDGKITIKLDGWLDTLSSPQLGEEIEKIEKAESIVLDFDRVEYLSSSGLRQIVACHRKAKELEADFSVINVCNEVMSIFRLTSIDKKLNISAKE